jgi:hypothetical protein
MGDALGQEEVVAWASGAGAMFAVTRKSGRCFLIGLDLDLNARRIAAVPDIEGLIVPPLGARQGVYLVYEDQAWAWLGQEPRRWPAPEGTRLTGAATSESGQLWVTAVDQTGGLALAPADSGGWRDDFTTKIPGFDGVQSAHLALAVRSSPGVRAEALIWGDGKAAVIVDRAVTTHRRQEDAGWADVLLRHRVSMGQPMLAQGPWKGGGARLTPTVAHGRAGYRAVQVVNGALAMLDLETSDEPILAAALTASGLLFERTRSSLRVYRGLEPKISHLLPDVGVADAVSSACAIGDCAVFQEHATAAPSSGFLAASVSRVSSPSAGPPGGMGTPLMPLTCDEGIVWGAARFPDGVCVWRQSGPAFAAQGMKAQSLRENAS